MKQVSHGSSFLSYFRTFSSDDSLIPPPDPAALKPAILIKVIMGGMEGKASRESGKRSVIGTSKLTLSVL